MGRRRIACQTCAAIKTSCNQGQPCTRCSRLSLPCSYRHDDLLASRTIANLRSPKTGYTRSRGGCLNCRRRRKKCDEQQPSCGDCHRLNLECISRAVDIADTITTVVSQSSPVIVSPEQAYESMGTADDGPQVSSPEWALAVAHVFERHISSSPFADWIALIEHEHRAGDPSPTNLANSAALVDLPIPCAYDDEAGLATFLPPTALNNLTGVTPLSLKDWSFGQRHLLNHFLQSVSRALVVVDDEDNPFLRLIVPMVLENAMVRHGLLALSACHLSRVYPVFEKDLLIHRSLALQKLRTDLVNHESQLYCLVTTLLLCLAEICEGRSRMWLLHLHGAKALLANIDAAALTEAPYRAMVDLYNYLCCVTSATAHDGPLPLFEEQFMPEDSHFHPLFGVATNLYKTISLISRLTQIMRNLPASTPEIEKQAQEIELSLQSWTPAENGAGNRRMSEARAAAFATQWALMLQLKQVMKNLKNDDPQITMAANNILSALSLIRPGSEIETRILFPLFMAGVGSVTKPNRLTVEYRLKIMESMIGFGNISVAHKLLDELWRRSNDGDTVDWEDLKEAQYSGLVLL